MGVDQLLPLQFLEFIYCDLSILSYIAVIALAFELVTLFWLTAVRTSTMLLLVSRHACAELNVNPGGD